MSPGASCLYRLNTYLLFFFPPSLFVSSITALYPDPPVLRTKRWGLGHGFRGLYFFLDGKGSSLQLRRELGCGQEGLAGALEVLRSPLTARETAVLWHV